MNLPFMKRFKKDQNNDLLCAGERATLSDTVPATTLALPSVVDNSIPHILVRIGKLSPFVLGSVLSSTEGPTADEDVLRLLVERKAVTSVDVENARAVQAKLQAGQPVYEEWAKMEVALEESRRCSQELSSAIRKRRDRRREQGEDTVMFVTSKRLRAVTT